MPSAYSSNGCVGHCEAKSSEKAVKQRCTSAVRDILLDHRVF